MKIFSDAETHWNKAYLSIQKGKLSHAKKLLLKISEIMIDDNRNWEFYKIGTAGIGYSPEKERTIQKQLNEKWQNLVEELLKLCSEGKKWEYIFSHWKEISEKINGKNGDIEKNQES